MRITGTPLEPPVCTGAGCVLQEAVVLDWLRRWWRALASRRASQGTSGEQAKGGGSPTEAIPAKIQVPHPEPEGSHPDRNFMTNIIFAESSELTRGRLSRRLGKMEALPEA